MSVWETECRLLALEWEKIMSFRLSTICDIYDVPTGAMIPDDTIVSVNLRKTAQALRLQPQDTIKDAIIRRGGERAYQIYCKFL